MDDALMTPEQIDPDKIVSVSTWIEGSTSGTFTGFNLLGLDTTNTYTHNNQVRIALSNNTGSDVKFGDDGIKIMISVVMKN